MKLLVIVVAEKWVNGLVLPACRDQPHGEQRPLAARASWLISACAELSYSGAGGQPGALALLPLSGQFSDRKEPRKRRQNG